MIWSSASRRSVILALAFPACIATSMLGCRSHGSSGTPTAATSPQYYSDHVQPILQSNCYRCHGGFNHRGGLQLDTRGGLMHGGKDGAVITPGHPEQSLLVKLIRHEGPANDPKPMPPKSKLSDADIAIITEWIRAGAAMPADQAR
jgi:cytochrome c